MCLGCIIADFPIAEKIYDQLETPTECRKNFKKCKLCGGAELVNEKFLVSDTASAGGTHGGASLPAPPSTQSVIFRSISFRHVCRKCGHVVAEHVCTFRSEGAAREVDMTCMLCGTYEDCYSLSSEDIRPEIMTR